MVTTSHASTHLSHLSHPSTNPSIATTHGSTADTLSLIDRGTPHQSEASRSDASLGHDDSISSSSTTRGADDDNGNNLFDVVFDAVFDHHHDESYTTYHTSSTLDTNIPHLRGVALSTQNYAAAVGNMGGQFAAAGAGEGTMLVEAEDGETQQPMMVLEDVPVVPAGAGGEWGIGGTVGAAQRHRQDMNRARWEMYPGTVEVRYIRGGQ